MDITSSEDKCLKCGKCCVIYSPEKGWYKCPYLDKNNLCTIYQDRLGQSISPHWRCGSREALPWDIPGCPYNTGKPLHPCYNPNYKY